VAAVATFLLLPRFGAAGMALAVALGLTAAMVTTLIQLRTHDALNPFHRPFARALAVALLVSALTALPLILSPRMPDGLGLFALIALLLAGLWLSLRYGLPREDRRQLGAFGRKLRLA
jgi:O-antigen/teichoic acid export membrane protein